MLTVPSCFDLLCRFLWIRIIHSKYHLNNGEGKGDDDDNSISLQYTQSWQPTSQYYNFLLHGRHNERKGVSHHRRVNCLLNRLFRCRSKKTPKLCVTGLCEGNPPVVSPHKGSVTRRILPFYDVVMSGGVVPYVYGKRTWSSLYRRANYAIIST